MFATIRRYRLNAGAPGDEVMAHFQDVVAPAVGTLPGLRSFEAIDLGEGIILVVAAFDGKDDAVAASPALEEAIDRGMAASLAGEPEISGGIVAAFVTKEQGRAAEFASGQPIGPPDGETNG